ncbi:hypothetical protein [Pantoea agglomerans]|uniref:hypothetical protein n=1 Tax=Enterobacter agglomerans TaxID=549 RepID=UPI0020324FA8|nr:hypothetical protein [Pantoea agglomerans]URW93952.1 hypothetical protein NA598_14250 [Pantoea agglomerans]
MADIGQPAGKWQRIITDWPVTDDAARSHYSSLIVSPLCVKSDWPACCVLNLPWAAKTEQTVAASSVRRMESFMVTSHREFKSKSDRKGCRDKQNNPEKKHLEHLFSKLRGF